jgi:hypothetical protein
MLERGVVRVVPCSCCKKAAELVLQLALIAYYVAGWSLQPYYSDLSFRMPTCCSLLKQHTAASKHQG